MLNYAKQFYKTNKNLFSFELRELIQKLIRANSKIANTLEKNFPEEEDKLFDIEREIWRLNEELREF